MHAVVVLEYVDVELRPNIMEAHGMDCIVAFYLHRPIITVV